MRRDLISIAFIIMLILSGSSVFICSAGDEKIHLEENEKNLEIVEDDPERKISPGESESESLKTNSGENLEEKDETTKTIRDTQNNLDRKSENEMKSDSDSDTVLMRSSDVNEETDHSQSIDDFTSIDYDSNQESIMSDDDELIIDYYDIVFKDDMTSLETNTTFNIYRIEKNGEIYTADDIRDADDTDELIDEIGSKINERFRETIDDAFPDADKDFGETEHIDSHSGPIEIITSANINLTEESLEFEEENDQLDISEVVKETMEMGANINKEVDLRFKEGHHSTYRFEVPEPYIMEEDDDWDYQEDRASMIEVNNSDGSKEESIMRELNITHGNPRYIGTQEEVSIEGTFELQDLEQIGITFNNSVSSIDIEKYDDDFTIPDVVKNLNYVDADFIRTAIDNGLVEWKTITDEMNNSIKEIENKMPGFFEGVDFIYNDPDRDEGTIIRKYEVEDFQPSITTDDEDIYIDNELVESLMHSGGIIDFGFSSIDEEYEDYSTLLKIRTPDFMVLHDSSGEIPREDGYYEIDPKDGFDGEFRSDLEEEELPDEQSISVDTDIDIENVNLDFDLNAVANTKVNGQIEIEAVEAPQDMKDSLSEEISLEYATADLIRQVEKRDMFDKQQILNMTRDGEDIDDFEGIDQILRDALGKEDVDVSTDFQEGTWESEDGEIQPIVLLIDSEFELPLRESGNGNAFDIYSIGMGEFEIPSIEGIDTAFRIIFPSGIRGEVDEADNVKTGETSDSRSYIEVNIPGDSDETITIDPEIIITSGIFFSTDIYLYGMPLIMIPIIIILIITSVVGLVVWKKRGKNKEKEELIKRGMEDALMEENYPDNWLAYIPLEKVEEYDIDQDTLFELELEEELQEMRRRVEKEKASTPPPSEEGIYGEEKWAEESEETVEEIEPEEEGKADDKTREQKTTEEETKEDLENTDG